MTRPVRHQRIMRIEVRRLAKRILRKLRTQRRRDYLAAKPRCLCHRAVGRCHFCCQECGNPHADEYFYPNDTSAGRLCPKCADCWCLRCMQFCAGMSDFDFSPILGFCGDCRREIEREDRACDDEDRYAADDFDEDVPDWNSYEAELRP